MYYRPLGNLKRPILFHIIVKKFSLFLFFKHRFRAGAGAGAGAAPFFTAPSPAKKGGSGRLWLHNTAAGVEA